MLLCGLGTMALAEFFVRKLSEIELIYPLEMAKYARALKQEDPQKKVSHIHVANASAKLMGVEVALNSLGNRGAEPKPPGTKKLKRILTLGSSVTMGWGVPETEIFTSILEDKLNRREPIESGWKYEVNNAGVGNYNSEFQYELFKRQFSQLKPDYVVLQYFISDAERRPKEKNNWIYKKSDLAVLLYDRISSLLFHFFEKNPASFYGRLYEENSADWLATQKIVDAMAKECATRSVPFWVMIIPDLHDLRENGPYAKIYDTIELTFDKNHIQTLNMFPIFAMEFANREQDLWVQSDDAHPNAKGHQLMAETFYKILLPRIESK